MNQDIFQSKLLIISVIFLFILLISSDVLPQRNASAQRDVDRLIREGKELYKNGEYREAIVKFLEAKDLARTREEISDVYFNLSSSYYASNQSVEAKEHLQKSLETQPERTIDALYYSADFVEMFNETKAESIKLKEKEKRPVVKAKPAVEKKVKKGGGGLLIVLGVLVIGGGVAALLLMGKKGNGGGNGEAPGPTTGSIQVNSSPTGAKVFLDGSDTGSTTNTTLTNVSPGSHTVSLIMEGYEDEQTSVSVTAGQTATVSVTLTKPTITVIELPPDTVWTTGKEVEIKWDTSGSGSSQGVTSTGAGLNPLINQGRRALSRFQRRAFQQRRFLRSALKEGRRAEDVDSSGNRGILSSNTSKPQGVSGEISSSAKEGDIVHKRAKDTGNIKRKGIVGRVNIPVAPQISNDKFTPSGNIRVLGLSNVKIELYKGSTFKQNIAESTENDGLYLWTVDPSLEDGTDYKVRISSPDDSTVYGESDEFSIEEKSITVTEPTDTTVWGKGESAEITWTSNGTISSVKIHLSKGGAEPILIVSDIANDGSYTWAEVDTSLEDGTDYKVRISSTDDSSVYDDSPNFKIQEPTLEVPSDLDATAVSSSQIDLSWTDNSDNESGFKIERKTGASGTWAEIDTVGADVATYQDTGLEAETTYYYRVMAYNTAGDSEYSNEASASTSESVPEAPTDLQATSVSSSQIDLSWSDNSDNESGFKVERKTGTSGTWSEVDTVNADVTTYQDTGLDAETTYYYRVMAYNGAGNSDYSNESSASTSEAVPEAPTDLQATSVSSSQIDLSWTDNSDDESGFKIERKTGASGTWSEIATVGADVTAYQDTGLDPETTYYYKVRAYNDAGNSGYSNEASASTSESVPEAPTDLQATSVSSSQIDLSWSDNSDNESGFKVERKTGTSGTWSEVDTVNADVTTYQDTGLDAETTYYYRVMAYNAAGDSDYSNEANAATIREIEWVQIPAGSFEMGDNFNEGDSDELPVHTVYLDTYSISKYEVTFEQYDAFCDATACSKPSDEGWGRGDRPVINVDWADAKAFCDWISGETGENIHLPTEAQWEKAARGTDQRRYPWGDGSPDSSLANYNHNVGKTMPVGSYPLGVSPYEIHDMAGNVWEFCSDWFDANYYSSSPTSNPQGPSSGSYRVCRGSSWYNAALQLRSATRGIHSVGGGFPGVGFRVCKHVSVAKSITVTEPTSSTIWTKGQSADITWTSTGIMNYVDIDLYKGGTFNQTIVSSTTNNASYTWSQVDTSLSDGSDYSIRITDSSNSSIYDESDQFTIEEEKSITVTSPTSGDIWSTGQLVDITWTSTGAVSTYVNLDIYKGTTLAGVAYLDNDGIFPWIVSSFLEEGTDYKIRISDDTDASIYDESDIFTINQGYEYAIKWGDYGTGNSQFNAPVGIAVDSSGNVYVTDTYNNRIQKFTSNGTYVSQWGSSGTGNSEFNEPWGIAADSSGNVYVADSDNDRIQKFLSDGTYVSQWGSYGTGNSQFDYPSGIAVDSTGNVYVADTYNNRIQKFTSNGTYVSQWGSFGSGDTQFFNPFGIAVDSSGYVYVADTYNECIQKFTSTGAFLTKWGSSGSEDGQFDAPLGIAVDSSGNVYVADTENDRIQKFRSDGTFVTKWGSYGSEDGEVDWPYGIAVDSSGYVYVADTYNDRIQKFQPIATSSSLTLNNPRIIKSNLGTIKSSKTRPNKSRPPLTRRPRTTRNKK